MDVRLAGSIDAQREDTFMYVLFRSLLVVPRVGRYMHSEELVLAGTVGHEVA